MYANDGVTLLEIAQPPQLPDDAADLDDDDVDDSDPEDYSDIEHIERYANPSALSYDAFFQRHQLRNRPAIIGGLAVQWDCRRNWTADTQDAPIDLQYLDERLSALDHTADVPVADCDDTTAQYGAHCKLEMPFQQYRQYWLAHSAGTDSRLLYLKDWHLRHQLPAYRFYRTPPLFGSDWLNEALAASGSEDYRFVYVGPAGTWTPLHSDVFGSFSWSTNVAGHKRWLFLPPGEEQKLADRFGALPFSTDEARLDAHQCRYFVVDQLAGETVFVPSGWFHQVLNVSASISVNHNWFNAANVGRIWRLLHAELGRVRREIADCSDMAHWQAHCQRMLRSAHGMDLAGLLRVLETVASRRIKALQADGDNDEQETVFDGYRFGSEHCRFDLRACGRVARAIADAEGETYPELAARCARLMAEIATTLAASSE